MNIKALSKKISSLKVNLGEKIKNNRKPFVGLTIILFIVLLLIYFKGLFIAATVNNRPIWRFTVNQELEKQVGSRVLDSLITKELILQEAGKQKISISDEEMNQAVKELEDNLTKQGQNLDALLTAQGLSRNELKEQIRLQKLVEKILSKDIKVTDEEINKYFEDNKTSYPDKTLADIKEDIKKQLEQEKLNEKVQIWIEDLRSKAKINYFIQFLK